MAKKKNSNNSLVFSSERGRICPGCGRPIARCICKKSNVAPASDGFVKIRREIKGHRGKPVTTLSGVPLKPAALLDLAKELKKICGTGGSVKNGIILIQGDKREQIAKILKEKGFKFKLAGG